MCRYQWLSTQNGQTLRSLIAKRLVCWVCALELWFLDLLQTQAEQRMHMKDNGQDTDTAPTTEKLEESKIQIARAIWGSYKTPPGIQTVNGDLKQVHWVECLSAAARQLL